jgi:hypothetical protein
MTESFWNIPTPPRRTPLSILREQANNLTQSTKGVLRGEVTIRSGSDRISMFLSITVPALANYRFSVLHYEQPVHLYPGEITSIEENFIIENEDDFVDTLKHILSSEQVGNVISGLLAQATADGNTTAA